MNNFYPSEGCTEGCKSFTRLTDYDKERTTADGEQELKNCEDCFT